MSLVISSLCAVVPLLSYSYFLTTFLFIFFCVYGLLVGDAAYLFIRKNLRVSVPYLIGLLLFLAVYLFAALSLKENEAILPLLEFGFLVSLLISFLIFKTDKASYFQEYVIPIQRIELALGIISTLSFLLSFLLSLFYPLNGEYGEISYSFTVILLVISILLCTYLAFKNKTKIPVKITLFF